MDEGGDEPGRMVENHWRKKRNKDEDEDEKETTSTLHIIHLNLVTVATAIYRDHYLSICLLEAFSK